MESRYRNAPRFQLPRSWHEVPAEQLPRGVSGHYNATWSDAWEDQMIALVAGSPDPPDEVFDDAEEEFGTFAAQAGSRSAIRAYFVCAEPGPGIRASLVVYRWPKRPFLRRRLDLAWARESLTRELERRGAQLDGPPITRPTASGDALRVQGLIPDDVGLPPSSGCLYLIVPANGGRPIAVQLDVRPGDPEAGRLFALVDAEVSRVVLA
jgi:hypothetical protein